MSYKTIKNEASAELTVKKSKFIATIKPIISVVEAEEYIDKIKKENKSARHNVYAYRIFESNVDKYSDDGEPAGTSGSAILSVMKKKELFNTVAVVTRYFGGILLGTGGLVSAYTQSFSAVLEKTKIINSIKHKVVDFEIDYETYQIISTICKNLTAKILFSEFTDKVKLKIAVPEKQFQLFESQVSEIGVKFLSEIKNVYIKEK
ncbi:MAG: YigZ family protein [Clostridia bacterium]|nr:YigZ family protein [Clostridia bacterium]